MKIVKRESAATPRKRRLSPLVTFIWALVFAVLAVFLWLLFTTLSASQRILAPNTTGGAPLLDNSAKPNPTVLNREGDGRISFLLIGRGGPEHPGGNLTDSIQVISINPTAHTAAFLSLPRDLLVRIPGDGYAKLNAVYSYAEQKKAGSGPAASVNAVSTILDMPIHYYVDVDFQGFKEAVDALGGITVNVKTGFTDFTFPDDRMVGYKPFTVKAGVQQMDGTTALKFARSRHSANPAEGSDFARSARQQLILAAMRDKALSAGTLSNPVKLTNLVQAVGKHLRTDISTSEISKLLPIARQVDFGSATMNVIDNSASLALLVDGPSGTQFGYHLLPKLGYNSYLDIQRYAHSLMPEPFLSQEKATVQLIDATGKKGAAADAAKTLKSYGYLLTGTIQTAPTQKENEVHELDGGHHPYTAVLLGKRFTATPTKLDKTSDSQADIELVLGSGGSTKSQKTSSSAAPY